MSLFSKLRNCTVQQKQTKICAVKWKLNNVFCCFFLEEEFVIYFAKENYCLQHDSVGIIYKKIK